MPIPVPSSLRSQDYPHILGDWRAISDYVVEHAGVTVDRESIEDCFMGAMARLTLVSVDDIRAGHPDANVRNASRERRYAKMDPDTMPPIVIEGGQVLDGNHRLRIRVAAGARHIWCYVVEEAE